MVELRRIVTGTDFSETSKGALGEALRLALCRPDGHLTVVHVTAKSGDEAHRRLREETAAFVRGLPGAGALPDERLTCSVVSGGVAEGIAAVAEASRAELIVVGAVQKGFVERYVTGGPAEQLISRTHVPVLMTRGVAAGGYNHILVPVDFSALSARVLAFAGSLAQDARGVMGDDPHITVLHAWMAPGGVHATTARRDLTRQIEANLLKELKAFAAEQGVSDQVRSWRVVQGVAQDVIPAEAEHSGVDLICMGSAGKNALSRRILGSTTSALMTDIQRPILVLWPAAEEAAGQAP